MPFPRPVAPNREEGHMLEGVMYVLKRFWELITLAD
jgi:hypothetical protein